MKPFFKPLYLLLFLAVGIAACEPEDLVPLPQNKLEANAGPDQQVVSGTLVSLDGSASKDGNSQSFTYSWTLKSIPETSTASLNEAATVAPTFTPDVAGIYVLELKIISTLGFATDEVRITATAFSQEPSAIIISEDITEDRVLEDIFPDAALADYIVTADVRVSASLIVKPGVRIEFEQDKGLVIEPQGTLIAKGINDGTGTSDKRIAFTRKSGTNGYWKGILLISNNPLNELKNVSVEFGGSSPFPEQAVQSNANVVLAGGNISGASLKISATNFYNSGGYGMYVSGMSEITKFENNHFENSARAALYAPARQLHKLDFFSHFNANNGFNGIETEGSINHAHEVVWPAFNDGSAYLVRNDIILESGLKIQPGASFEFKEGQSLYVMQGGYLEASGTEASKITFTARTKTPGYYWGGIFFNSVSEKNRLSNAEVSYGGNLFLLGYEGKKANVIISTSGKASVESTSFRYGLGWGLIAYTDKGAQVNANVTEANSFEGLPSGHVKFSSADISQQELTGEWLDEDSFIHSRAIDDLFYDQAANRWFRGAASPWSMNPQTGFGLKVDGAGNYLWTIAQHGPAAGCGTPYSAEYITGSLSVDGNQLQFEETYWRSMFYNPCDESQSVDTNITPGSHALNYTLKRTYDLWTGEPILELSLYLSSDSVIKYYKR